MAANQVKRWRNQRSVSARAIDQVYSTLHTWTRVSSVKLKSFSVNFSGRQATDVTHILVIGKGVPQGRLTPEEIFSDSQKLCQDCQ